MKETVAKTRTGTIILMNDKLRAVVIDNEDEVYIIDPDKHGRSILVSKEFIRYLNGVITKK